MSDHTKLRRLEEPPEIPRGPEGEPLGLEAAEIVLYCNLPNAETEQQRSRDIDEATSHFELAEYMVRVDSNKPMSAQVEKRLGAVRDKLIACASTHPKAPQPT
jgi:hypothetical protein